MDLRASDDGDGDSDDDIVYLGINVSRQNDQRSEDEVAAKLEFERQASLDAIYLDCVDEGK